MPDEPKVQQAIFSDDNGNLVPKEKATHVELIFEDGTNLLAVVRSQGEEQS